MSRFPHARAFRGGKPSASEANRLSRQVEALGQLRGFPGSPVFVAADYAGYKIGLDPTRWLARVTAAQTSYYLPPQLNTVTGQGGTVAPGTYDVITTRTLTDGTERRSGPVARIQVLYPQPESPTLLVNTPYRAPATCQGFNTPGVGNVPPGTYYFFSTFYGPKGETVLSPMGTIAAGDPDNNTLTVYWPFCSSDPRYVPYGWRLYGSTNPAGPYTLQTPSSPVAGQPGLQARGADFVISEPLATGGSPMPPDYRGTYYVVTTLTGPRGEGPASAMPSEIGAVTRDNTTFARVASPKKQGGATGYNVYLAVVTGGIPGPYYLQNPTAPIPLGAPFLVGPAPFKGPSSSPPVTTTPPASNVSITVNAPAYPFVGPKGANDTAWNAYIGTAASGYQLYGGLTRGQNFRLDQTPTNFGYTPPATYPVPITWTEVVDNGDGTVSDDNGQPWGGGGFSPHLEGSGTYGQSPTYEIMGRIVPAGEVVEVWLSADRYSFLCKLAQDWFLVRIVPPADDQGRYAFVEQMPGPTPGTFQDSTDPNHRTNGNTNLWAYEVNGNTLIGSTGTDVSSPLARMWLDSDWSCYLFELVTVPDASYTLSGRVNLNAQYMGEGTKVFDAVGIGNPGAPGNASTPLAVFAPYADTDGTGIAGTALQVNVGFMAPFFGLYGSDESGLGAGQFFFGFAARGTSALEIYLQDQNANGDGTTLAVLEYNTSGTPTAGQDYSVMLTCPGYIATGGGLFVYGEQSGPGGPVTGWYQGGTDDIPFQKPGGGTGTLHFLGGVYISTT